mmetsp:Transcript_21024/g.68517  ORF Transcript_21024/g.68517 Transcript_21024/m.68517 type:complete len:209 (+) Transcript_21024:392-1018(+)
MLTVAMFSAAFDMRYDHQPPSRLSPIEPTRADRLATIAPFASSGAIACAMSTGPSALVAKTLCIAVASIEPSDRSGIYSDGSVSAAADDWPPCSLPATLSSRSTLAPPRSALSCSVRARVDACSVTSHATGRIRPGYSDISLSSPSDVPERLAATMVLCGARRSNWLANPRPRPRDAPETTTSFIADNLVGRTLAEETTIARSVRPKP